MCMHDAVACRRLLRFPRLNNHALVKGLNVIIFKVFLYLLLCIECHKVIVVSLSPLVPSILYIMHKNVMDPWK